ncbi:hypothetical protein BLA50215_00947 [Burkholderia lata]|nr:hypothetical protein BLA50215_00947 [Burkholderia lata]
MNCRLAPDSTSHFGAGKITLKRPAEILERRIPQLSRPHESKFWEDFFDFHTSIIYFFRRGISTVGPDRRIRYTRTRQVSRELISRRQRTSVSAYRGGFGWKIPYERLGVCSGLAVAESRPRVAERMDQPSRDVRRRKYTFCRATGIHFPSSRNQAWFDRGLSDGYRRTICRHRIPSKLPFRPILGGHKIGTIESANAVWTTSRKCPVGAKCSLRWRVWMGRTTRHRRG